MHDRNITQDNRRSANKEICQDSSFTIHKWRVHFQAGLTTCYRRWYNYLAIVELEGHMSKSRVELIEFEVVYSMFQSRTYMGSTK